MNGVLLGLLAYVLVQLSVGVAVSRRIRTESDYLLAGRSLGPVLATFSIFATWFGAETCIGAAGAFYAEGLAGGAADPFGYAICLALMGLVLAVPLWRRGLTTLADLFRARYGPSVERLAVIVIAPSSVLWAAAQVRAFGQVLAASSALEVEIAIAIAAGVVILYTAMGGLLADAITDVVQGIAVLLGLVLLLPLVIDPVTGVVPALAASAPERLDPLGGDSPTLLAALDRWAIPICGSLVAQELVSRVIASRTPTLARNASLVAAGVYLFVGLIPASIGLLGPALVPGLSDPEQILPLVAQQHLPIVLYVLFAGALVSAILSTVDSALLAAASLVSHNLILPLVPGTSEAGKVRLARGGVVAFGFLAWGIALQDATVYDLVEMASALGSAGVFVIVVLGLFTRVGGPRAASAALVTGCAVWIGATATEAVSAPYLAALATAFAAYFTFAAFEPRADRREGAASA
jgi:Na+/proline symporter